MIRAARTYTSPSPSPQPVGLADGVVGCGKSVVTQPEPLPVTPTVPLAHSQTLGLKVYEFSNHLGNVITTFSDRKIATEGTPGYVAYSTAEILSSTDYYPFGFEIPGRVYAGSYRYGFQGQEDDPEVHGSKSTSIYFKYRIHDTRIGRFLSVDPLSASYPYNSSYAFSENRVIDGIELEGAEYITYIINVYDKTGGVIIDKIDHTCIDGFNTEKWSKSFGKQGRGIKYIYHHYENGTYQKTTIAWEVRQKRTGLVDVMWKKTRQNLKRHGFFYGPGCITYGGPQFPIGNTGNEYDFTMPPIDMVDAIAREHDIEEATDYTDWKDPKYIFADIRFVKRLLDYKEQSKKDGYIDPYTGLPASKEAQRAANLAIKFFNFEINRKLRSMKREFKRGNISKEEYNEYKLKVEETRKEKVELPSN